MDHRLCSFVWWLRPIVKRLMAPGWLDSGEKCRAFVHETYQEGLFSSLQCVCAVLMAAEQFLLIFQACTFGCVCVCVLC